MFLDAVRLASFSTIPRPLALILTISIGIITMSTSLRDNHETESACLAGTLDLLR